MPRWSRKSGVDLSTLDDEQNETEDDGMRQSRDDKQGESVEDEQNGDRDEYEYCDEVEPNDELDP